MTRERDALIAERVMEWKWWKYPAPNHSDGQLLTLIAPPVVEGRGFANHVNQIWQPSNNQEPRFSNWDCIMWSDDGFETWQRGLPHYFVDIAAAWQVIEKMQELGLTKQFGDIFQHSMYFNWYMLSESAFCEAICNSALEAVNETTS